MSFQVSTASVQEFKTIVSLLLQQQGSRLRPAVNVQAFVGKAVSVVEQFGPDAEIGPDSSLAAIDR